MQDQSDPAVVITPEPAVTSAAPRQPLQTQVYATPEQQPQQSVAQQPSMAQPGSSLPSSQPGPQVFAEPQQVAPLVSPVEPVSQTPNFEPDDDILLSWQSSEFDEQDKSSAFYLAVAGVAVALTAVVFWVTGKDIFASVAVFLAVLGVAYLASHKPATQDYALANHGIYIGNKARAYEEFKNFSVSEEAGVSSVMLVPHKRFGSPLILRLNHEQKDDIVQTLSQFLPLQQRKLDAVDQLMRRMRL